MKNLLTRSLTGAAFVAIILAGILWNRWTFGAVMEITLILCLIEFYKLVNLHKATKIKSGFHALGGTLLFLSSFFFAQGETTAAKYSACVFFIYILTVLVAELYERQREPLTHSAYIIFGQVYIALPLSLLNFAAFCENEYSSTLPLALFIFIWLNDTFAYLSGITLGKHRLFERISPKKSWEGFFGGLVFTVASAFLFSRFVPEIPLIHWVGLSIVTVVFAVFGDLLESLIKRTLNVKDSGSALPGHGGFLDRFDSLLFAIYGMVIYCMLIL